MDGHDVAGLDDVVDVEKLLGGGVPGDVDLRVALVNDTGPQPHELLMTRKTEFSLPGMREEAKMTVSPGSMVTLRCSECAIRDSAAIGSPCEPVTMRTCSCGGNEVMSRASMRTPSGTLR